jgi:hypothetical protein
MSEYEAGTYAIIVEEVLSTIFFGSFWYIGLLIFMFVSVFLMRKWKYAGVLIIPIVLALEVAYYEHLDSTGMLIVPMVILLILAFVVGFYALMSRNKNDD